jgi:hypothetical protein
MKYDGMDFQLARHLTFRAATESDKTLDGDPIPSNYVVFVPFSKCPEVGREKLDTGLVRVVRDPKGVPGVPLTGHSLTNMAYGQWRKSNIPRWVWKQSNGDRVKVWAVTSWTCPVYLAYNGRVYTSTIHRDKLPDNEIVRRAKEAEWKIEVAKTNSPLVRIYTAIRNDGEHFLFNFYGEMTKFFGKELGL